VRALVASRFESLDDVTQALSQKFLRTFGNIPFGVSLLALWGTLTLIGVIVQQNQPSPAYFAGYPAPIARAILRMNFDDIYHSVWYLASIGLVLLSMTTATFTKVIPRRLPPYRPVKLDAMPLHAKVVVPGDVATVQSRVETFFAEHGFRVRRRDFDGTEWTFADRFNWARIGVLVNHFAVLVIASGAIVYWIRGFSGETAVLTGQATQIPRAHAIVRLDKFSYTIQPTMTKGGMVYQPIDYVSHVTVTGPDGVPRPEVVRVNHPIDIGGTLLYQASYGFGMRFLVEHDGRVVDSLSNRTVSEAVDGAPFGDSLHIPGTMRTVVYQEFVPTVDPRTRMPSPDPRVGNPATILAVADGDTVLGQTLVALHSWLDLGGGWRIEPEHYILYSGLQYTYDPGVPLVAAGAVLLLIGLIISFYFLPARFHVRVEPAQGGACTVGLAATTVKGYDIFEDEFKRLVAQLGNHVAE
jgi:cytochrome c biogenesis protein